MLTCKALLLWEFPEALKHQLLPEKTVNLGGWALLSGTYPCAWVSMYHQDSCLWRYDLIEPQQVNGITADNYLNNFPDAPTSSSSPLVLEMFWLLGIIHNPMVFFMKDLRLQFNCKPKLQHQHSCCLKGWMEVVWWGWGEAGQEGWTPLRQWWQGHCQLSQLLPHQSRTAQPMPPVWIFSLLW